MEKKLRILVVEDDLIQLDWASKTLGGNELIKVKTREDYFKTSKEGIDLIITDLMIPFNDSSVYRDNPNEAYGLEVFLDGLDLLSKQQVGGLALISNYEHHTETSRLDNVKKESSCEVLYSMKKIFYKIGKSLSNEYLVKNRAINDLWKNDDCIILRKEGPMNIVFAYDVPFYFYSFFFDTKKQEVVKRKDFVKGIEKPYGYVKDSIQSGGCVPLKPYEEIVRALFLRRN